MQSYGGLFFYVLILSFLFGVALASLVPLSFSLILFLISIGFSVICCIVVSESENATRLTLLSGIFVLMFGFGMLRLFIFRQTPPDHALEEGVETSMSLAGVISKEPMDTDKGQRAVVRLEDSTIKIQINTDCYPRLSYGDRISFSGILKKPEVIESDSGRTFDYPAYLEKDGIYYTMNASGVEIKSEGKGSPLVTILISIKHAFVHNLELVIPKPESGLLSGYLVEGKQSLSKELQEEFKIAGVIHTVALSGYNVTIIVQAIMNILAFLPRSLQLVGGAISIVLFTIMTGASATVVRAAVMALVAVFATANNRSYNVSRALMLAGFLMVLWNPMTLLFDPSFQLSFLATLGLIHISPVLAPKLAWIPGRFKLRETITSTLSAQLAVLPLILYSTNSFSIVALPTNILMLPEIPLTMFTGSLAGGFAFVSKTIAQPFGWATYFLLHFELMLVHFFSKIPYAAVTIPFPLWLCVISYILAILWLSYNSLRSRSS